MMDWCRLWHDMPNDPKFRTIARLSQSRTSDAISVFVHLMVSASANAGERGRTQPNAEDLASALDLETERVEAILTAMQGRLLDGDRLTGWKKRQPKREDGSPERSYEWRQTKKLSEISGSDQQPRTHANANERKRPIDETRRDETRRDSDTEEKYSAVTVVNGSNENLKSSPTNGRNGGSSGLVDGSGKQPSSSKLPPNEPTPAQRQRAMHDTLFDYMSMDGQRKVKPPDDAIVKRCISAIGNTPVMEAALFLRERYVNHEQSPRHPNGPRGYAWFAPVLLAQFNRGKQ